MNNQLFQHNTIERIRYGADGYRLISFAKVLNFPKCKPLTYPSQFADYKNGVLRIFNSNSTFNYTCSFKEAISIIRNTH